VGGGGEAELETGQTALAGGEPVGDLAEGDRGR